MWNKINRKEKKLEEKKEENYTYNNNMGFFFPTKEKNSPRFKSQRSVRLDAKTVETILKKNKFHSEQFSLKTNTVSYGAVKCCSDDFKSFRVLGLGTILRTVFFCRLAKIRRVLL